jgi:hypothetical protein
MIAAHPNGEKELLAVEDGWRESAESWNTVLRELKRLGMVAPVRSRLGDYSISTVRAVRMLFCVRSGSRHASKNNAANAIALELRVYFSGTPLE